MAFPRSILVHRHYRFREAYVQGCLTLECQSHACHNGSGKDAPVDEKHSRRGKKWVLVAMKIAIVGLVVWFIRRTIVDAWTQLGEHPWQFDDRWLAISGVLYLLGTMFCGVFWHRILRVLGQPVSLPQALRAYYIGQLGKYVPGKAMVVILRTGFVQGQGINTSLAAASVFFETLTMMSSGALIGAAIVAVWYREQTLLFWAALAVMATAGLPTLPPVFRRLTRLVGVGRSDPSVLEKLADLGYGTVFLGWILTGLGWAILGLSFGAVLRGLGVADAASLEFHLHTAAVTLATVAGFISFIPGGAVIREAVLTELMTPHLGGALALVSAILLRLVWLVSELIISGILYCIQGLGIRD
jgi:uncharacterized membrane protein YbhN (UPF0104 family)